MFMSRLRRHCRRHCNDVDVVVKATSTKWRLRTWCRPIVARSTWMALWRRRNNDVDDDVVVDIFVVALTALSTTSVSSWKCHHRDDDVDVEMMMTRCFDVITMRRRRHRLVVVMRQQQRRRHRNVKGRQRWTSSLLSIVATSLISTHTIQDRCSSNWIAHSWVTSELGLGYQCYLTNNCCVLSSDMFCSLCTLVQ